MKRFLLIAVLLFLGLRLLAQGQDVLDMEKRLPVLGKIVTSDSLLPVRNTHVISKMGHCGTISNRDGVFFIPARMVDTLWVSCLGYARKLIPVDSTLSSDTMQIMLERDTITLKEVTIWPFYDYKTFKQMIIDMPSKPMPREIQRLNEELAGMRTGRKRDPYFNIENGGFTASPIQYLYDKYNSSARRQNKLLRNRKMFNEILREQGRTDELLPDSLDYSVEYNYYIYDTIK
ncbi:MAG: carboxypeptidase-like regulatory domain-containing protein [Bacteroidales bacterium]|nr:carboxypeptidase-like regulatory domain-containing protein [Bacteroidales bacterium]